jgi:hypothetical protein
MQAEVPSRLLTFRDLSQWTREDSAFVREVDPNVAWDELVISWNMDLTDGTVLEFEAEPEGATRAYRLGTWSAHPETKSTSHKGEKDEFAEVQTDTLVVKSPARKLKLRIRFTGPEPKMKLLTASFRNSAVPISSDAALKTSTWGKTLEPPMRAQMNYPNGNVICSPTSTSMVLGYWATELNRPQIDQDVPVVCAGVFDPGWNGTGNWSFNMAFAGQVPGMRAYVSRMWNLRQLEQWIDADVPVVCSVSYSFLKGEEKKKANDGHLVVLVGFTKEGDPVFNDPGRNVVRMTYKRADFERAWASSGRTTYLIYPKTWRVPENLNQVWVP